MREFEDSDMMRVIGINNVAMYMKNGEGTATTAETGDLSTKFFFILSR